MKVAFIHSGALGDLILSLPVLQTLRRDEAEQIDLFAAGERARFLAGRSVVNNGHSLDSGQFAALFNDQIDADSVPSELRDSLSGYEDIVSAYPSEKFTRNLKAVTGRGHLRDVDVQPDHIDHGGCHASEFLHRQLFGMLAATPLPQVTATDADKAEGAKLLGEAAGDRGVVIHPGSGGKDGRKCWPLDSFLALADALSSGGRQVCFVLGEVEAEWMDSGDRERLADKYPTLTDLSLEQLGGVLASAGAYVGNDSGPSHLAAALGTPTVALFGPTNPAVWAPRGPRVHVLRGLPSRGDAWGIDPAKVVPAVGEVTNVAQKA